MIVILVIVIISLTMSSAYYRTFDSTIINNIRTYLNKESTRMIISKAIPLDLHLNTTKKRAAVLIPLCNRYHPILLFSRIY